MLMSVRSRYSRVDSGVQFQGHGAINFSARIACQDFSRCSAVVGREKWPWTSIQSFDMFMERAERN